MRFVESQLSREEHGEHGEGNQQAQQAVAEEKKSKAAEEGNDEEPSQAVLLREECDHPCSGPQRNPACFRLCLHHEPPAEHGPGGEDAFAHVGHGPREEGLHRGIEKRMEQEDERASPGEPVALEEQSAEGESGERAEREVEKWRAVITDQPGAKDPLEHPANAPYRPANLVEALGAPGVHPFLVQVESVIPIREVVAKARLVEKEYRHTERNQDEQEDVDSRLHGSCVMSIKVRPG